jgi:hypothetical protein
MLSRGESQDITVLCRIVHPPALFLIQASTLPNDAPGQLQVRIKLHRLSRIETAYCPKCLNMNLKRPARIFIKVGLYAVENTFCSCGGR